MWRFDLNAIEGKMGPNMTFLTKDVSYLDSNSTFDVEANQQTLQINVFEFQKLAMEGIFETQLERCH